MTAGIHFFLGASVKIYGKDLLFYLVNEIHIATTLRSSDIIQYVDD